MELLILTTMITKTMTCHKSEKAAETDAKVKAALEGLSNGLYSTPYAAAQALQLSRGTLHRRLAGGKSRSEGKENQQNLTHAEEQALARWITHLTATGHPARHGFIKEIAEEIRRSRHAPSATPVSYPDLGDAWVPQFLSRHPSLQTTLACAIESARIKEVSSGSVLTFFAVFSSLIKEYEISVENIYNMDETGIPTHYSIDSDRIYGWRKSNQLCCSRFSPPSKVSSTTRTAGMDYSNRMYLFRWIINSPDDNLQRKEFDDKLDTTNSSKGLVLCVQYERVDKQ